jgi:hypothetical protein
MSVPYVFATRTDSIPLAELDANFTHVNDKVVFASDYGTLAGDGVTDDAPTIIHALNNAPDGAIVWLPPTPLGYRCSLPISIPANKTLAGMTEASNENITSATLVFDLAISPCMTVQGITSVGGGLLNIAVSRAAGAVPAGSVGILFQDTRYTRVDNVRIYRQAIGAKFDGCLGLTLNRFHTSQITESHIWLDDAIQIRFVHSLFGQDGASDVVCNEYVKLSGVSDTVVFTSCQFNHGGVNLAARAFRFDNFTSVNGLILLTECYIEMCTAIFSQTGTTKVPRMSFVGCGINPDGTWDDGSLPSGFFEECNFIGCPVILRAVTLTGMVRTNVIGNTFQNNLTISAGSGAVAGNSIAGNLTVSGAAVGLTVAGNALTGGASVVTNTATGQVSVFGNSVAVAVNHKISPSRFEKTAIRTLATDRAALAYSASMTLDAADATRFVITPSNGVAFTINAPTNLTAEQEIEVVITNNTGGALGAATWNAIFKMAAWTQPATGFHRGIRFWYDGSFLYEICRNTVDIPN